VFPEPRHGHRDRLVLQEPAIAAEIADHLHVRHELGIALDQLGDRIAIFCFGIGTPMKRLGGPAKLRY
jgi:hypothetical protein